MPKRSSPKKRPRAVTFGKRPKPVHSFDTDVEITPESRRVYAWRTSVEDDWVEVTITQGVTKTSDNGPAELHRRSVFVSGSVKNLITGERIDVIDAELVRFPALRQFAKALLDATEAVALKHPDVA